MSLTMPLAPSPRHVARRALSLASLVVAALADLGAQPTTLTGRVLRPNGDAVRAATVELFETEERALTDSLGQFRLRTRWAGPGLLVVRAVGDPPVTCDLVLPVDTALTLVLPRGVPRLMTLRVRPAGEFTVSSATASEALTPLDIVQTAGAAANVARALQIAPGVSAVDEGTGLFVRGGDVTETRVLVDDVVMLSPARFDNPTGHVGATLNPFLLADATLSAGAFGAAHGNALSGIVRLQTAGRPTRSTGSLSASVGSASADGAFAITPRFGARVHANLNDLGPLVAMFGEAQPYDPPPRGGDAALTLEVAPSAHGRVRLFTTRQRQQFGVGAADFTATSSYAATTTEALTVLSWRDTARTWRPAMSFGRSTFTRDEARPGFSLGTDLAVSHAVATLSRAPGARYGITLGVEHERLEAHYRGGDGGAGAAFFDVRVPSVRTGAHGELSVRVGATSQLVTGLRVDRSDFTQRTTIDPRVSFATQRGAWGVVASVGAYHQVPEPILVREAVATPMRVVQGTLAVERGDADGARLRIEAYARRWAALAQFTPDFEVAGGGSGEAVGVDSEWRWQVGDASRMRLVWSVLDARRTDPRTGVLAPAPSSITHSVAWISERTLGRLSINSALRYATGRPFTNIVGGTPTVTGVAPVFGAPNADRLPGYWRSDLSVSWLQVRRTGPTAVFWAAISNVFDRRNIMRYTWNADFTERTPVRSPFNRSVYAGATLLLP